MAQNKPNSNKWNDIQIVIAAISMTSVLAFWNMFAGPDREKADQKANEQIIPAPTQVISVPNPMPTVPPVGYTILFGGVAPQPQVIIQSSGGGNNNTGGGSAPVTSTGSS